MTAPGSSPAASPGLDLEFVQRSDMGRLRRNNEDYCGQALPETAARAQSHGWLFVLADGVGGQQFGEVASRAAVENVVSNFRESSGGESSHTALLRRLIQAANHVVYETGRAMGPGGVAMATTIVACSLRFDRASIAHVGDSRCYLVRAGEAVPLTRDHTVSSEQVRLGVITAKEEAGSANRHLLSRSLGNDLFVNVETSDHLLLPEDVFLLCSDGLHNSVGASDIARLLRPGADLKGAAAGLISLANERDGSDNITLQLIRVRSVERTGMYRGRRYRLR